MPATGGAAFSLPIDFAPLTDLRARLKDLRGQAKEVDKEIATLAKKGKAITPELVKKSVAANAAVSNHERVMVQAKDAAKAAADDQRARKAELLQQARDRVKGSSRLGEGVGHLKEGFNKAKEIIEKGQKIWHAVQGNDDRPGRAWGDAATAAGGLIKMVPHPIARAVGTALEVTGEIAKVVDKVREAGEINEQGRSYAAAEKARKEKQAREIAKGHDTRTPEEILEGLRGMQRHDPMVDQGLDRNALRDEYQNKVLREKLGFMNASGLARGVTLLSPEVQKEISDRVNEAVSRAQAFKKAGQAQLELGDFDGARTLFREANKAANGSAPNWHDPASMWEAGESDANFRRNWAASKMNKSMKRTD